MNNIGNLLAFWVSFLHVLQAKKGICCAMQTAASAHAALVIVWQTKGFLLWCHLFRMQTISTFKARLLWNLPKIFYRAPPGSRMTVLDPRDPVLYSVLSKRVGEFFSKLSKLGAMVLLRCCIEFFRRHCTAPIFCFVKTDKQCHTNCTLTVMCSFVTLTLITGWLLLILEYGILRM